MTQRLETYIKEHQVCSELLFRDWRSFLEVLYAEGGRVTAILWYEYVLISMQASSLGGGGYKDRQNSDCMWAETPMYVDGFENKPISAIVECIEEVINAYPENDLIPSFFVD